MQTPAREVVLGFVEETIGIGDMAGDAAEQAQVEDTVPLSKVEHLLLDEEVSLVAELLAQVAEDRGGLVADLTGAERGSDPGQRLQLGADTQPVGSRGDRHAAGAADPGGGGDVATDEVLATLLDAPHHGREFELHRINQGPYPLGIVVARLELAMLEPADRRL